MGDAPERILAWTVKEWGSAWGVAPEDAAPDAVEYVRADLCDPLRDERVRALVEAVTNLRERANIYARAVDIQAVDAALRAIKEPPTDHDRREEK